MKKDLQFHKKILEAFQYKNLRLKARKKLYLFRNKLSLIYYFYYY